ncbi:hypothetical protein CEXT_650331 [Caerostris extrusa]|uniref:Uncharacterized protein n=1 Tax=Caerostris extrusa TaxID=172846 RepID=A0AAV4N092_CAEEX|nr:hypothetical protein CEXT_650331 [Caerostris extrusa]
MQNIIKENEITKTETLQEKLCENITNSLKAHAEKISEEQITIQLETTTENETTSEQETAQATPQQKAGQQPSTPAIEWFQTKDPAVQSRTRPLVVAHLFSVGVYQNTETPLTAVRPVARLRRTRSD